MLEIAPGSARSFARHAYGMRAGSTCSPPGSRRSTIPTLNELVAGLVADNARHMRLFRERARRTASTPTPTCARPRARRSTSACRLAGPTRLARLRARLARALRRPARGLPEAADGPTDAAMRPRSAPTTPRDARDAARARRAAAATARPPPPTSSTACASSPRRRCMPCRLTARRRVVRRAAARAAADPRREPGGSVRCAAASRAGALRRDGPARRLPARLRLRRRSWTTSTPTSRGADRARARRSTGGCCARRTCQALSRHPRARQRAVLDAIDADARRPAPLVADLAAGPAPYLLEALRATRGARALVCRHRPGRARAGPPRRRGARARPTGSRSRRPSAFDREALAALDPAPTWCSSSACTASTTTTR